MNRHKGKAKASTGNNKQTKPEIIKDKKWDTNQDKTKKEHSGRVIMCRFEAVVQNLY